jgi:hypothetical protein
LGPKFFVNLLGPLLSFEQLQFSFDAGPVPFHHLVVLSFELVELLAECEELDIVPGGCGSAPSWVGVPRLAVAVRTPPARSSAGNFLGASFGGFDPIVALVGRKQRGAWTPLDQ